MATSTEIMDNIPPKLLDAPVEDIDIEILAKEMTEWELLAPFLGLKPGEICEIAKDYAGRFRLQKREALGKWKEKLGEEATYRSLITIMCEQGRADLADTLKNLLLTPKREPTQQGLSSSHCMRDMTGIFHDYLVEYYSSLPHPSSLQWPTNMTSDQTYVQLNLLDVPLTETGPTKHSPITLKCLFSAGNSTKMKRKVILVEGVAGAGKTTLTWYAFKEWAEGRLFEDIKLLIQVSLSDQSIHSATNLADLIPYHSDKIRTDIAETIIKDRGRGVCFWFDGCDEAPPTMWSLTSFIYRFISGSGGREMLPNAHLVLTSRPGISLKLLTTLTLSGKVILQGFLSPGDYFAASLPNQGAQLIEALKLRPELYSLCHLPLHAAILAYIYDTVKDNLPTTRTGLFYPLMQNFIIRHMLSRTNHQDHDVADFPANLPDDIRSSLLKVSRLAFENIIHGRKIFDRNALTKCDLDSAKINDALGFLRVHTKFTISGPTKQFSFTHLSFQEFLAAFHISRMDEAKQVVAINIVFHQNPTSPVLAFYAGLTKLHVDKVREIYFTILSKSFNPSDIVSELRLKESQKRVNIAHDRRRQLLCLMNGLYEAQNKHLFTYVNLDISAKNLESCLVKQSRGLVTDKSEGEKYIRKTVTIPFLFMYLYPTDCLSVGFFVRHACSQTKNWVYLDLSCAVLREIEIKALMQEMHKPASSHNVYLNLNCVYININSLHSLSTVFNPQSCLCGIETSSSCFLDKKLAFKYLVEGYARSNCTQLKLSNCSSESLHYILLMLKCQSLHVFKLYHSSDLFSTPGKMNLFSEALKYNIIGTLGLTNCCIDDESLLLLGRAVCYKDCSLTRLEIDCNTYTEEGLTQFFKLLLKNLQFLYLQVLSVDHYNDKHRDIVRLINVRRNQIPRFAGLHPPLTVGCKSELENKDKDTQDYYKSYDALMRFDLAFHNPHH